MSTSGVICVTFCLFVIGFHKLGVTSPDTRIHICGSPRDIYGRKSHDHEPLWMVMYRGLDRKEYGSFRTFDLIRNPVRVFDWHSDGGWNEGMDRLPQTLSFPITMTPRLRYVKVIRRWGPWWWGWNLPQWTRLDFAIVIVIMVWVEVSSCVIWKLVEGVIWECLRVIWGDWMECCWGSVRLNFGIGIRYQPKVSVSELKIFFTETETFFFLFSKFFKKI